MKLGQRALLLAMGLGITAWGGFGILQVGKPIRDQAIASEAWPSVIGRIAHSRKKHHVVPGEGYVVVTPDIGYDYEVDGTAFTGRRVWIGDESEPPWFDANLAAIDRYPVGREVAVHYDPAKPSESVLEPGVTWTGSMLFFIGVAVLTLGLVMSVFAFVPAARRAA